MSIFLAGLASLCSGISVIFSKTGMKNVSHYLVSAITNSVIFLLFTGTVIFSGQIDQLKEVQRWDLILLSGIALAISWIFYYLGLKDGPVSTVLALQNLSIVFTMVLGSLLLGEPITVAMVFAAFLMAAGTILLIEHPPAGRSPAGKVWIFYELFSSAAIALSFVLTKMDRTPVDSNLSSSIRYLIVMILMWLGVFVTNRQGQIKTIEKESWKSILWGGIFLGLGYMFFYRALPMGLVSMVTTIFRMNIIVSTLLSIPFLQEKLTVRGKWGLGVMTAGVLLFTI